MTQPNNQSRLISSSPDAEKAWEQSTNASTASAPKPLHAVQRDMYFGTLPVMDKSLRTWFESRVKAIQKSEKAIRAAEVE